MPPEVLKAHPWTAYSKVNGGNIKKGAVSSISASGTNSSRLGAQKACVCRSSLLYYRGRSTRTHSTVANVDRNQHDCLSDTPLWSGSQPASLRMQLVSHSPVVMNSSAGGQLAKMP